MKLLSVSDAQSDANSGSLERYLKFVRTYIERGIYPGSPEIIRSFLRENDNAILMELHNTEIEVLKSHICDQRIAIHHRNCYEGLKALTPPPVRRGFLLMDPSYEVASDYTDVASSLIAVQKRWNVGVQLLWYPLLKHRTGELAQMLDTICFSAERNGLEYFTQEFVVHPAGEDACIDSSDDNGDYGLYGSGMLFVNPPWHLKEELTDAVETLTRLLG